MLEQRTEQIIVNKTKELVEMFESSTTIYNYALFLMRQSYFNTKTSGKIKTYNLNELYNLVKNSNEFKNSCLDYNVKQQIIKQVISNWTSFIRASIAFKKYPHKFNSKTKMPRYLKNGKLNIISIDETRLKKRNCKENEICLPKSTFKFKTRIKRENIDCVILSTFYDKIKINIVYKKELKQYITDKTNCVGIDIGLNNLASITSNNQNLSWIINGRPLKSINQYYNKKLAELKSKLQNGQKTSKRILILERKRKNKINHFIH